ncbi:MAG: ABC transporter ATP-binding protein, partial [Phyllobacterium sp.]
VLAHHRVSRREARDRAIDALAKVGIPEPVQRYGAYPHQLSGGMRQRAMIAIALVCEPRLLIADEPTTALDVTVQAQIMDVLGELCSRLGMAMLFITHDLGLVSETCSRLVTMYAGEVVEQGSVENVLIRPRHPYSSGLLRSLPSLSPRKSALPAIKGRVPPVRNMPAGCRFQPRCLHAQAKCELPQILGRTESNGEVRCCRSEEIRLAGVLA